MAEYCRECFIREFQPTVREIRGIVLSDPDDLDLCEGCGEVKRVVVRVRTQPALIDWISRRIRMKIGR